MSAAAADSPGALHDQPLKNGTVLVSEQIPGYVVNSDVSTLINSQGARGSLLPVSSVPRSLRPSSLGAHFIEHQRATDCDSESCPTEMCVRAHRILAVIC